MSNFWNERYSDSEYVYGEEPNVFYAEQLSQIKPGFIIMPCEGEGRNAIYAALNGWKVNAFDLSEAGKIKANKLAHKKGVEIEYTIDDAVEITFPENTSDVVAFIYAHFPPAIRKTIHRNAINWLKPGGKIILEAFNLNQLQNSSGGPKEVGMLYTEDIVRDDFEGMKIEIIQTAQIFLQEGKFHEGKADVIRFIGVKV
jgi:cyclopropane fatty-acyl-phospholipid synthase-like methyltransferase